ncbi:winged helix-turn-helix domain-containing protein [Brevibacillus fluminis]|uniref:winged helix-turn-helix domain-containing protein n=1 Tax=Brevibacillus fluminis TaxID=511487 RepID=UPI003F8ABE4A
MIHFEPDTLQAVYAGESIQLLPKEFALLRFLYEHPGRIFSRDELLDAVWPLETPVDRTVDDHIYRVRKKLTAWSHLISVETIRGQGYKLTRHAPKQQESPLLQDEEFAANVKQMLVKYHGLGMGAAMQLLSSNRDVLGLPGDPFYDAYLHFVRGDFSWLIHTDTLTFWQKASYAVFVHAAIQRDPKLSLSFAERLIAKGDHVEQKWMYDLQLNIAFLYLQAGMLEKARRHLDDIRQMIMDLQSPSFTAIFLLKEMYTYLLEGKLDAAASKLRECETLLAQHPIQRERGAFLVGKAFFLYLQGAVPAARKSLDDGIETTRQTQFIPHLINNLHLTLTFLSQHVKDESYRKKYQRQWDQLADQYHFGQLLAETEQLLNSHL